MNINTRNIERIVINTQLHPVDLAQFTSFLDKSPHIHQIAFVGKAIFDTPDFISILEVCAAHEIYVIFGEVGPTTYENLYAMVQFGNVISVNIYEEDPNLEVLTEIKNQFDAELPEINVIVKGPAHIPQNGLSDTSYAFYNLADDTRNIDCLNMLEEPMINYDGGLIGCWQNTNFKYPVNAFDLGMDKAINHKKYKKIIHMLKTLNISMECPCARCPIFASLVWSDKTIDLCKHFNKK